MKKAWINADPESGYYRDDEWATEIHKDGRTTAEMFPGHYFTVPLPVAWLLQLTGWLHHMAQNLCSHWRPPECY